MCTLLYQRWPAEFGGGYAAVLGLNRDELYARPAAPPRWWPPKGHGRGGVGFVAPVDLRAGGTWFGLAETGLFVAITNGRPSDWSARAPVAATGPAGSGATALPTFRHERSRGELVTDSLRLGDIDAAAADLATREAAAYAPCHLLLAHGDRAAYVAPSAAGESFAVRWLTPGPHALTNSGLDRGDTPDFGLGRVQRSKFKVQSGGAGGKGGAGAGSHVAGAAVEEAVGVLRGALATHEGATARCRHGTDRGTRSSAIVFLGPDLDRSRLFYADGPTCTTPYGEIPPEREARRDVAVG